MKYVLFSITIIFLGFWMHSFQVQHQLEKYVYDSVNYALKHSVHDSALFVNQESLSEGMIIFDQEEAHDAFLETMKMNLPVNEFLIPEDLTLLKEPITILDRFYIDDVFEMSFYSGGSCLPTGENKFPCMFSFEDSERNIQFSRPVFGPSVVYIVEILAFGSEEKQQYITIQEYKG